MNEWINERMNLAPSSRSIFINPRYVCYLKKTEVYVSRDQAQIYIWTWASLVDAYIMLSKSNGRPSALSKVLVSVSQFNTFLTALLECMVAVRLMNQCHSVRIHPSCCTFQAGASDWDTKGTLQLHHTVRLQSLIQVLERGPAGPQALMTRLIDWMDYGNQYLFSGLSWRGRELRYLWGGRAVNLQPVVYVYYKTETATNIVPSKIHKAANWMACNALVWSRYTHTVHIITVNHTLTQTTWVAKLSLTRCLRAKPFSLAEHFLVIHNWFDRKPVLH